MAFRFVQCQPFTLAGSGAVLGATSIILTSFKDIDGTNLAMSDFGAIGYGTLEPNASTQEEQISFTGVTQNGNGTATLTGVKSVAFKTPYTETVGLLKSHAGGVNFVISNTAGFYNQIAVKQDDETVTGKWTFPGDNVNRPTLSSDVDSITNSDLVTLGQLARTSFAGTVNATTVQKGISQEATTVQIDADTAAGSTGAELFVNPALLVLSKYGTRLPSADEKAALVGTSGAASGTNKYVTNNDTTGTGSVVRESVTTALQASLTTNVQIFNVSGTWTKPSGAKTVEVICVGGGGGGGGGKTQGASSGGTGGGGGAATKAIFNASDLSATETVTVGAAGAAGAAASSGGNGTASSFGTWLFAGGGGGGQTGSDANNSGGGGGGVIGNASGTTGGVPSVSAVNGISGQGPSGAVSSQFNAEWGGGSGGGGQQQASGKDGGGSIFAAGGGGGGGGWEAVGEKAGGNGGLPQSYSAGGGAAGGVAANAQNNGTAGSTNATLKKGYGGGGGGGGNGRIAGAAGNGGAGGAPGGGGGGGGNADSNGNRGLGGIGAVGVVKVITHF